MSRPAFRPTPHSKLRLLPKLPKLPFRSSLHVGADLSAALGLLVRVGAPVSAGVLVMLDTLDCRPFSFLINLDQQNARYVSRKIAILVAHCY